MPEEEKVQAGTDEFDAAVNDLNTTTEPDEALESEQAAAPEGAEPKQEATKEPSEPTIDLDGEQVPISQIKQWKSGHMMQSDYTRKTQELAREREQLNLLRQAFEDGLYGVQPPPQYTPPAPVPGKFQNVPVEETIEFATPTEEKLYKELQEVKGVIGSINRRQVEETTRAINARIDSATAEFMRAHPDVDTNKMNEIMSRAASMDLKKVQLKDAFEFAYRGMVDTSEIERRAVERYLAEQKKKPAAALESPAGVSPQAPPTDITGMSEEDIFQAALRDLKLGAT